MSRSQRRLPGRALLQRRHAVAMRFVKGAGFLVRSLAPFSMAISQLQNGPPDSPHMFEMVKRGNRPIRVIPPVSSKIVGLIGVKALRTTRRMVPAGRKGDSSLILKNRLEAVMGRKMAVGGLRAGVEPFVEQLRQRKPATPGGGSAAAAAGRS